MKTACLVMIATVCTGLVTPLLATGEESQIEPALGWEWVVTPIPIQSRAWSSAGVLAFIDEDRDGDLVVVLGYSSPPEPITPSLRAVAFDEGRKRHNLSFAGHVGSGQMKMWKFRLDHTTLPPEHVESLGVEILTFEGRRAISERAAETAASKGIDTLPFPEVDSPYEFSLTTTEGARISDRDFRGKVLVVDCWATWCGPCMKEMPKLRALYKEIGPGRLAILGITLDQTEQKAVSAVDSLGLPWAQVFVPQDTETRLLWYNVSTVMQIPRLFVVDQEGILRGDLRPPELEEFVRALLDGGE